MGIWQRLATWSVEGEKGSRLKRPRLWRWTTVSILILAVLAPVLFPLVIWPIFTAIMVIFLISRLVLQRGGSDALAASLMLGGLALAAAFIAWQAVYWVLLA